MSGPLSWTPKFSGIVPVHGAAIDWMEASGRAEKSRARILSRISRLKSTGGQAGSRPESILRRAGPFLHRGAVTDPGAEIGPCGVLFPHEHEERPAHPRFSKSLLASLFQYSIGSPPSLR